MFRGAVSALSRRLDALVAAFFGALYFVLRTDLRLLDPTRVDLLDASDYGFHVVGAQFFQQDAWRWPLTRMANYFWPVGTTTVYTDSNPWLSLAAKLLLPSSGPPLQMVGGWLVLCFTLQGYFGARLCRLVTSDRYARAAGGCLLVLTPALLARLGHDTLCAHWLVLAAMTEALLAGTERPRPASLARLAALLSFAAGLHPTLFAMIVPFGLVVLFRCRPSTWPRVLSALACIIGPLLVFVAFGTLRGSTHSEVGGFGLYSANLLALLDPMDASRSRFLTVLPHEPTQYEGFAFLGAGALSLLLASIPARRWTASPPRRLGWSFVFGPALACAVYALSGRIYCGHRLLLDLSTFYAPFHAVTNAFRSSGRFVWPLGYSVVLAAIAGVANLPRPWGAMVLAAATSIQAFDSWQIVDPEGLFRPAPAAPSPAWSLVDGDYDALLLDPADIESNGFGCPDAHYEPRHFLALARVAVAHRLKLNSGQAARVNEDGLAEACAGRTAERARHHFDPRAIYVPADDIHYGPEDGMRCGRIDETVACVREDRPTRFGEMLTRSPQ